MQQNGMAGKPVTAGGLWEEIKELVGANGNPPPPNDKDDIEKIRASDDSYVKVGRWMSPEEFHAMRTSGRVQEGAGGQTFAATSGPNSFIKQAKPGSVYVEFQVQSRHLLQGGRADWVKFIGPNAPRSQQMMLRKQGGELLPKVRDIQLRFGK
jgi:hypothetical protein